jgi:hypothetical protein
MLKQTPETKILMQSIQSTVSRMQCSYFYPKEENHLQSPTTIFPLHLTNPPRTRSSHQLLTVMLPHSLLPSPLAIFVHCFCFFDICICASTTQAISHCWSASVNLHTQKHNKNNNSLQSNMASLCYREYIN